MKKLHWLRTGVCLMAFAVPQLAMGQVVLVESDAMYHYLLTIADINGSGMAVDPTAIDPSFAVVNLPADANSQISNVALWPFPEYDPAGENNFVAGIVRGTEDVEVLQWRQAKGPFQYGGMDGIVNGALPFTDPLVDSGLGFTEDQLDGQKLTQYFRTNFTTAADYTELSLDVLIDDSAVFYIDGFEVARYNCCFLPGATGPETAGTDIGGAGAAPYFDSVANGGGDVGDESIRNNNWDPPWMQGVPNVANLVGLGGMLPAGDHVFGVEVHSYGNFDSSDMGLDVRVTASGAPPGDPCDFDGNMFCDTADIDMLTAEIATGGGNLSLDINGDGSITVADRDEWLSQAAIKNGLSDTYLLGDANLDGSVNAQDLNELGLRWQQAENAFSHGDFNADGNVTSLDLNELGLRWQRTVPAAAAATAVPEPSSIAIVLLSLMSMSGYLRKRRWQRGTLGASNRGDK